MMSVGLAAAACALLTPPQPGRSVHTRREALALGASLPLATALPSGATAADASSTSYTRLALPRLGLGAWAWGDSLFWGYDKSEDGALSDAFDFAVESGVRFFDTAEVYGLGRSETLLGQFAARSPASSEIVVATKFAALPWRTKPADVLEAAKKSTERLGRPIDLYQIHFPNAYANAEYWDGLGECVDSGLVRAAGVSNYGAAALEACSAALASRGVPLTSNQVQFSLLYPYALTNGLKAKCDELGVQTIAYSPLGLGILTGKFKQGGPLPKGPRKKIAESYLADPAFAELVSTMRGVGDAHGGAQPAPVALAWCLAKGFTSVIPGARNVAQAKSNAEGGRLKLSPAEVAALDAAAAKVAPVLTPDSAPFVKEDTKTHLRMFDS